MKRFLVFLLLGIVLLSSCQSADEPSLRGRILFWHDWDAADTAVLNELIDGFHALHPEVRVVTVAVPSGTLRQRYEETASLGLGPDLLVLSDADVRPFADINLIRPLLDAEINADKFLSTALDSLRYQDALYGLPLSLRPMALYYNADQVEKPARTLEELLQQAEAGQNIALNAQFAASLWGLTAFGGTLFNEEEQVVLNQGGYTNWLSWLKTAQDISGVTLDRNDETLRDLFVSGRVAYYVGGPEALSNLRERMGEATVRVVSLPAGPGGPSGPLLQVEAILFNQASSDRQAELALILADYLTNAAQNARLMRETDRVPANRRVRVDQQLFPVIAGFIAQARTAVAVPQLTQMDSLVAEGDDMLRGVLTGLVNVNDAAQQLAQAVNDPMGLNPPPVTPLAADCDAVGEIMIGHTWRGAAEAALTRVAADFMAQCAETSIQLVQFTPTTLLALLDEGNGDEPVPDLILGPSEWAAGLTDDGLIASLNGRVDVDLLQQYVAAALNTVEVDGQLIGLPVNLNVTALYYNGDVISDPATTLGDLLIEASEGNKVAIPLGFENAYWGVSSFGGSLFDNNSQLTPVNPGFIEWLTWLQQEQSQPGVVLSGDDSILQALFSSGAVVYYTGSSRRLNTLQSALGTDTVRVTELPGGPNGVATPLLSTDVFYLNRVSSPAKSALALAFSLFATDVGPQTTLMTQAQIIPANINVDSSGYPAVAGFLAQAQTAVSWPAGFQVETVRQEADQLYESVVLRQLPPLQVACDWQISLNQANGIAVDETTLPDICTVETDSEIDE